MCLSDSVMLPQTFDSNERFRGVDPWKRLIFGDGLALFGSLSSVFLDRSHKVPEMPKFTYLFLYNIFLSFNLVTSGYFFAGS